MSNELSVKQKKKLEAQKRRKTRERVAKFRAKKRAEDTKSIQIYLEPKDKEVLDRYKAFKGQTISEVFSELITSILKRRLIDLEGK
jgi:hypothetical protein